MRLSAVICTLGVSVLPGLAQTTDPGTGAPSEYVRAQFVEAFGRGSFSRLAALPPAGPVRRFGATGLIQEFNDATRSGSKLALIKATSVADPDNPNGAVRQVWTDVYAYYSTVGVTTAGYPVADTAFCPASACTWQTFNGNYALFAYSSGANDPQNISVRDPFFTRWNFFGGISKMGPPTSAETNITSASGSNATLQSFTAGLLFNITSGALSGRLAAVREPIYTLYIARGGQGGSLGLPTGDEQILTGGKHRQVFEGGSIEYDDTSGPVVRSPVSTVLLRPSATPVRLNAGDSLSLQATVLGTDGQELTDRVVNFSTTNGRVASIQGNGLIAMVRAAGGGTARITASSEGKTSAPVDIIVTAQCCAVGEGAPDASIQQALVDAVARNKLQLRIPGPERVKRAGSGYVQEFQAADPNASGRYLLTISDRSAQAFVVSGPMLSRYEMAGGPAGALAFAVSDLLAAGRQLFEGGALAGTPARIVAGAILTRWGQSGYEAGTIGLPLTEAVQATSFTSATGQLQSFAGGTIVNGPRGPILVRGPVADKYLAVGGIAGDLGFPVAEEISAGGLHRQEFEGGSVEYAEGDSEARTLLRDRIPAINASPAAVVAGGRVRIAISGFPNGAVLRVVVAGQQEFIVQTQTGAYSWDSLVPASAAAGSVSIRALDTSSGSTVSGAFTVRTLVQARVQVTIVSGDTQSGPPGTVLSSPLRVILKDDSGMPVSGVSVRFNASPGATVTPESVVTDASGMAEARLQLPATDGVAVVTAEAAGKVATFSARSAGAGISNFPKIVPAGSEPLGSGSASIADTGALLASVAAVLRYGQIRGEFKSPNGLADLQVLNDYLKRTCVTDSQGSQVCDGFIPMSGSGEQIVNLWRLGSFVGTPLDVSVEQPDMSSISSLTAGGTPVIVALSMSVNDRSAGSHFVVATGIASDGSLQLQDPAAAFARRTLTEYLNGFGQNGQLWRGAITGAFRLLARLPSPTGFVVSSMNSFQLTSKAGDCGVALEWPDQAFRGAVTARDIRVFRQRFCSGSAEEYQLEASAETSFEASVTDLSDGGSRSAIAGSAAAAFRISRTGSFLAVTPQTLTLDTTALVNAASLTPALAPGSLFILTGSGLSRRGAPSRIEVGGRTALLLSSTAFQLTAQMPPDLAPGTYTVRVESSYGSAEQTADVLPVAPAIFKRTANRGAVINADGTYNDALAPAKRGEAIVIYATGLGPTSRVAMLDQTIAPVTVITGGRELTPTYAGLTPGMPGLYQVNVVIPATFPPGLDQTLQLKQMLVESSPVNISIF